MASMAIAALVLTILAVPSLTNAAEPSDSQRSGPVANVQHDARQLRDSVRDSSVELGQRVSENVHQARHQFTLGWHQAEKSVRHWWDNTRETIARI
jgi:hypothetical protein